MAAKFKPDEYHTLTPFTTVSGADGFVEFLKEAFGADVTEMMRMPDGRIAHAEARIGDSLLMLTDGAPMPIALYVYLPDADGAYRSALRAGATSHQEPAAQMWGDRQAAVKDSWGNMWFLATHEEDVSPEEMEKRMAAAAAAQQ